MVNRICRVTWTNATITPLERPRALAGKAFLTETEAAAFEKQVAEQRVKLDTAGTLDTGSYNQFWYDAGTTVLSTRQTSLVVDPPDGQVPVRPSAEARRDDYAARSTDSYEFMSVWDRCITRGIPGSMFPAGYNNAYQIIQTPGYVTIVYEMIHDARIIPLDNRPPPPPRVQTWMGESRGRWDGNTLVIETTNFNDKGWITTSAASGRIKGIPHTDKLRVIERLTRISRDEISYSATIEDPDIYTRPWTVAFPLTSEPDYRMYRVRLSRRQLLDREHSSRRSRPGESRSRQATAVTRSSLTGHRGNGRTAGRGTLRSPEPKRMRVSQSAVDFFGTSS